MEDQYLMSKKDSENELDWIENNYRGIVNHYQVLPAGSNGHYFIAGWKEKSTPEGGHKSAEGDLNYGWVWDPIAKTFKPES